MPEIWLRFSPKCWAHGLAAGRSSFRAGWEMSERAGQGQEGGEWQGLRAPAGPFPPCGQILHLQRHRSPREQLPGVPPKQRPEIIAGVQGGCEVSDKLRLGPPHELRKMGRFSCCSAVKSMLSVSALLRNHRQRKVKINNPVRKHISNYLANSSKFAYKYIFFLSHVIDSAQCLLLQQRQAF